MKDKIDSLLFGPFIGELNWELYRFAPYAIYHKKENPDKKLIVLTRNSRFDLYGKHADILVPLKIRFDQFHKVNKFRLDNYPKESYELISKYFFEKYNKTTNIVDHFYPRVDWRYSLKWQYPRDEMDFDFHPRQRNIDLVNSFIGNVKDYIVLDLKDSIAVGGNTIHLKDFVEDIGDEIDAKESSFIGSAICLLMKSKAIVGNFNSAITRLGALIGKPVITFNEERSDDEIHLLNPKGVPIFRCSIVEEGIEKYENNF